MFMSIQLSTLEESVLKVLKGKASRTLFGRAEVSLTSKEIFNLLEQKPSTHESVDRAISNLKRKKAVKVETDSKPGVAGKFRLITIL